MTDATKGPWQVAGPDHDLEGYKITDTGPTQSHDGDGASEYIATAYDARNARLIAAAPDLLDALKAFVSADDRQLAHTPETADRARAVIAKAEGTAAADTWHARAFRNAP